MHCDCCGAFDGETNAAWVKRTKHLWKPLSETHEVVETIWGNLCQFCAVPEREYWSYTGNPQTARCGRCSLVYDKKEFRKGLRFMQFLWCKQCRETYRNMYRTLLVVHYQRLHPEKQKQWAKANPDKIRKYHETWIAKHPGYWQDTHKKRKERKLS